MKFNSVLQNILINVLYASNFKLIFCHRFLYEVDLEDLSNLVMTDYVTYLMFSIESNSLIFQSYQSLI